MERRYFELMVMVLHNSEGQLNLVGKLAGGSRQKSARTSMGKYGAGS